MRIMLHCDRRLLDLGLDALRDVLAKVHHANSPSRPWTRGWRGAVTVNAGTLVVEASKRTSAGRRQVRVVAGPEAIDQDAELTAISAKNRLGMLVEIIEKGELRLAADDRDVADRTRKITAAFGLDPPSVDWISAIAVPGSSRTPAYVDVRNGDGSTMRLSQSPKRGETKLNESAVDILSDDALHVDAFESGNDVFMRCGTAPRFKFKNPTSVEMLRILKL